jgi:hypothetical protein
MQFTSKTKLPTEKPANSKKKGLLVLDASYAHLDIPHGGVDQSQALL